MVSLKWKSSARLLLFIILHLFFWYPLLLNYFAPLSPRFSSLDIGMYHFPFALHRGGGG